MPKSDIFCVAGSVLAFPFVAVAMRAGAGGTGAGANSDTGAGLMGAGAGSGATAATAAGIRADAGGTGAMAILPGATAVIGLSAAIVTPLSFVAEKDAAAAAGKTPFFSSTGFFKAGGCVTLKSGASFRTN
jgi:hypothetical protein